MWNKIKKIVLQPGYMDLTIFFVVMFLIAFGIIMVYSSSFHILFDKNNVVIPLRKQIWVKQLIFGSAGIIIAYIISKIRTKICSYVLMWIYPLSIVLLIVTSFFGKETRGAARSISAWDGFLNFQPSELAKLGVIIVLAITVEKLRNKLYKKMALVYLLLILIIPVALVAKEDFSTGAVIALVGGAIIFVGYRNKLYTIFIGGLSGGLVLVYFYFAKGNRQTRMKLYASGSWSDANNLGRQTVQSLMAIGSGGIFGKGLGRSLQKMGQVTQAHHDIIFAIICEEWGIVGAVLIIALYSGLYYQMLRAVIKSMELRDALIVTGIMVQIAVQVIVNIGVATNSLPNTGMPLPFISYGGSSMIILCIEMGLVLGITRNNQYNRVKILEKIHAQIQE